MDTENPSHLYDKYTDTARGEFPDQTDDDSCSTVGRNFAVWRPVSVLFQPDVPMSPVMTGHISQSNSADNACQFSGE